MDENAIMEKLYKQHNVILRGTERQYYFSAFERRIDLEHATPIELQILVDNENGSGKENYAFERRAWTEILSDVFAFLQKRFPKSNEELYEFKADWSKAHIFTKTQEFKNMIKINDELYLSKNFTAVHFSWIIGDILRFYGIKRAVFIVHRPPKSEPQDIQNHLTINRIAGLADYLKEKYNKSEEATQTILKNISIANRVLRETGASYHNFYLIDNSLMFSTYKNKLVQECYNYVNWSSKDVEVVSRHLRYLSEYLGQLRKKAPKNNNLYLLLD